MYIVIFSSDRPHKWVNLYYVLQKTTGEYFDIWNLPFSRRAIIKSTLTTHHRRHNTLEFASAHIEMAMKYSIFIFKSGKIFGPLATVAGKLKILIVSTFEPNKCLVKVYLWSLWRSKTSYKCYPPPQNIYKKQVGTAFLSA